jgi:cation diffusion facilitator family transporter
MANREVSASRRTVVIALLANATIAVAKLGAGLVAGSAAMLAEAAHSLADTSNQVLLLVSLGLSTRPADASQPFGHGQERFLWTFVAALGMFFAGALFAVGYGLYELITGGGGSGDYLLSYAVLALALAAEGTSWVRATRQNRAEAHAAGRSLIDHVRRSRDPNVKMVFLEDSAALIGIALAGAGIGLHQLTGSAFWDPLASILIGVLLMAVALFVARDTRRLLTGAAALPEERMTIERVIESFDEIDDVVQLLTMVLGPHALLVAARVDVCDAAKGDRIEQISTEIDRRLREEVPDVSEVFLDATSGRR